MPEIRDVAVFIGSLRRESFTRRIAVALGRLAPPQLKLDIVEIGANHHLRQSLVFLDIPTLQQPEVDLGGVANLVDEQGNITNDSTREFLTRFMNGFARWIEVQRCHP